MRFFVSVTDKNWFQQLAAVKPDEVNFWRPGQAPFRALNPGEPLLFKLHSPDNYIVGGGYFRRYWQLPVSLAWGAFGEKNGVRDSIEFLARIRKYRKGALNEADPTIGCIILLEPFFLEEKDWIPIQDWPMNVVQGKGFETTEMDGALLWRQLEQTLLTSYEAVVREETPRYGEAIVKQRLGQGAFRIEVTEAYRRRCAISGERTLPVLQAAHIKPYSLSGPHDVANGLCLRADMHLLYDQGLLTVTPELRVEVSKQIKERYENGKDYYAFHGSELAVLPSLEVERPSSQFLEWHNENVFAR